MKLILASQSANRKRIMEQVQLEFEVIPSKYEEDMTKDMPPGELVQELALGKAMEISEDHPDAVVIGADTFFVVNGKVDGKPHDNEQALSMLKELREAPHSFYSGYAIVHKASNAAVTGLSIVNISLRDDLTDVDLRGYIKNEVEPVTTKAGAYDGANLGIALIEKIDGDYAAALGLPIGLVLRDLKQFGINPLA